MVQHRAILTMANQIQSRIWSIERRHFQWPWTIFIQFQNYVILWRWIFQKRCEIDILLVNTNRDLHTPYSTVSFQMTLSDLEWLSIIFNDTKRRAVSMRQLSFLFGRSKRRSKGVLMTNGHIFLQLRGIIARSDWWPAVVGDGLSLSDCHDQRTYNDGDDYDDYRNRPSVDNQRNSAGIIWSEIYSVCQTFYKYFSLDYKAKRLTRVSSGKRENKVYVK